MDPKITEEMELEGQSPEVEEIEDVELNAVEQDEADEKAAKRKKERPVTMENLVKKFKSPIQGSQRKVQDWEDRTAARLKKMGFKNVGYLCLKFEGPDGHITATITSDHAPRSSRGKVKFVLDNSMVPPAPVESEPEVVATPAVGAQE